MDDQWKTFENTSTGVSIEYPNDWGYEEDASLGAVLFAHAETLSNQGQTNPFAPNVNVICHRVPGVTLDSYTESQVQRLKQMSGGMAEVKVDRSAQLGGFPAHKAVLRIPIDPTKALQLYSIWSVIREWAYTFIFSCEIQDFSKLQRIVTRMLTSFKAGKPKVKSVVLAPYESLEGNVVFRYPPDWDIEPRKTETGPLIKIVDAFKEDNKQYRREIKLTKQKRTCSLEDHVKNQIAELQRMLVSKVSVEKIKLGSVDARVLEWKSDAVETNNRYVQVIAFDPASEDAPVVLLTMTTNTAADDEYTPQVFNLVARSLRFLSDSTYDKTQKNWSSWEHLIHRFSIPFDPNVYTPRDEMLPLMEVLFVHKDDAHKNLMMEQPSVSFSIIIRPLASTQEVTSSFMSDMCKDIIENLRQIYDNLEVTKELGDEQPTNGRLSRVIMSKGSPSIDTGGYGAPEMCFVHKVFMDADRAVAVLVAFSSTPAKTQKEWTIVENYLNGLAWN